MTMFLNDVEMNYILFVNSPTLTGREFCRSVGNLFAWMTDSSDRGLYSLTIQQLLVTYAV